MLVLSRRVGDEITLPELGVTIRVLQMKGKVAKIGVEAPRENVVLRGELVQRARKSSTMRSAVPTLAVV